MAESMSLDKSMTRGSDILPDIYCDPCHEGEGQILQAAGFCQDCSDNLCHDCISAHKKHKLSRNHRLLDKIRAPHKKSFSQIKKTIVTVKCHQHEGEVLQTYCRSCDQLCCNICQTVDHQACSMQSLTKAAANIKDLQQLNNLDKKLKVLKKRYDENLNKAEKQSFSIDDFYTAAITDMKKLQEQFEKLLAETEKKADTVKNEDLKKMESISTTCNILSEQISKMSSNLDEMQNNTDNETIFVAIKRAESQLKSFEDRLIQLETDNTIQQYTFEPEKKVNAILDELKTLGKLSFTNGKGSAAMPKNSTSSAPMPNKSTSSASTPKNITSSAPMLKTPVFIKDIDIKSDTLRGSTILPNQRLLLTDGVNKVMLMDTKKNTKVSELQLPYDLWDATQVKDDEVAITCRDANKIQFVSVSSDKLSKGREMSVDGDCRGITYNDQDDTLIVTYQSPLKVEILSLTGKVIKRFDRDANGAKLFSGPWHLALSHDKTMIYVADVSNNSVTLMTLAGEVKAVYKDTFLETPMGVCVNRSGIVYVVGHDLHTVHQIVPGSDKLEPLLDQKNGLKDPWTVTYCDFEDKLYVGQFGNNLLKVFKMR